MEGFRWGELFSITNHPIFIVCIIISLGIFINSLVRKDKGLDYT